MDDFCFCFALISLLQYMVLGIPTRSGTLSIEQYAISSSRSFKQFSVSRNGSR